MNKKSRHIGKRKVGSSARKSIRKLHTSEYTNSCFTKKKIVLYFKEDTIDSEKLQSAVPSLTSWERTIQATPSKMEERRKKNLKKGKGKEKKRECERKKKGKGEGKREGRGERVRREEERGKNGESDTKSFFLSTPPPPDTFPSTAPSSDIAREQHNSHKGGTREKHNSYKQKTIETKRQLTISKQTSCNDDQTLTLHYARIPITSKKGRRLEA